MNLFIVWFSLDPCVSLGCVSPVVSCVFFEYIMAPVFFEEWYSLLVNNSVNRKLQQ